jgi:hypothetical protein
VTPSIFRHIVPHFPIRERAWQQGAKPLTHGNGNGKKWPLVILARKQLNQIMGF